MTMRDITSRQQENLVKINFYSDCHVTCGNSPGTQDSVAVCGTHMFRGIPDTHRGTMRLLHNSCDKISINTASVVDSTKK